MYHPIPKLPARLNTRWYLIKSNQRFIRADVGPDCPLFTAGYVSGLIEGTTCITQVRVDSLKVQSLTDD